MTERPTHIWPIDSDFPDPAVIEKAAAILRSGGLVAFPTETVYGLGANALDSAAVAAIYRAKGRPARNPVIVHVASPSEAIPLVRTWTATAQLLAERFWPGPLTLVLPRSECVPDIVTGGGPTVAVRCPTHRVALALIRAAGVPIAAPSANRSSNLSPTLAQHVVRDLSGRIDAILDGGPTSEGIESTVIDLSQALPRLLRPGPIALGEIEKIVGVLDRAPVIESAEALPSPGMLTRHYAPKTPLRCYPDGKKAVEKASDLSQGDKKTGLLTLIDRSKEIDGSICVRMPNEPVHYAARLYQVLHELDEIGLDCILVELPPETDEWLAVRDRLLRAAAPDDSTPERS